MKTDGSSNIIAFAQNGNRFDLSVPVQEVDNTASHTTAVTVTLGSVPTGVKVEALLGVAVDDQNTSGSRVYVSSISQSDQITLFTASGANTGNHTYHPSFPVLTNTSAQIRYRASAASVNTIIQVHGWIDQRGTNS